eukprot:1158993-Pelagomonas_calceolata.AAC.4
MQAAGLHAAAVVCTDLFSQLQNIEKSNSVQPWHAELAAPLPAVNSASNAIAAAAAAAAAAKSRTEAVTE